METQMKRSEDGPGTALAKSDGAAPVRLRFPFLDLKKQYAAIKPQADAAVLRVMESQQFILGPDVRAFEEEVAAYLECRYAVGCASGTDALILALMAAGVGAGDEVIAPSFTFVATVGSIVRVGAKPVFVDIDPSTFNLDAKLLGAAVTDRTKAIIPVHLFGLPADMDPILNVARERDLGVIEDAAQAIGSRYHGRYAGSMGTMGCFSFFPSKNLGGAGDGGMVTTNDPELADRLRVIHLHGSRKKYAYDVQGTNSRLDSLQAAVLRVKMPHLDYWTEGRRANAERYRRLFAERGLSNTVRSPLEPEGYFHVYNQFTIRVPARDALQAFLKGKGVPSEIYYPYPLHLQPAFGYLGYRPGQLPYTEAASREVLSLPIYPELTEEQQVEVVNAVVEFHKTLRSD
jgi:dTDP-4-amino-4,6-dideoxygalactose transaminase